MKCNLSFKSIVLIVTTICVSSQLSLYTLPKEFAKLYGAACLDGTPPAFYYAPAANPAFASNFQIFYEANFFKWYKRTSLKEYLTRIVFKEAPALARMST